MSDLNLALVCDEENLVSDSELANVAAAIQLQLDGDLMRIWNKHGSITWYPPKHVPDTFAAIVICRSLEDNRLSGFHSMDSDLPYANVLLEKNWSVSASHEAIEMVLDSTGNEFIEGPSLTNPQETVHYLKEICDPCGAKTCLVPGFNVPLADFCSPSYFTDPYGAIGSYSCALNPLNTPRSISMGGYLTWRDSDGQWWQQTRFGSLSMPTRIDLPRFGNSFRESVDHLTFARRAALQKSGKIHKNCYRVKSRWQKIARHSKRILKSLDG